MAQSTQQTWTEDELTLIEGADEISVAPARGDGTFRRPVVIWVVRVGDDLYVRAYRGVDTAWYRQALAHREGEILVGRVHKGVNFLDVSHDLADDIDAAYVSKYHRYPASYTEGITGPKCRATTFRLEPH